MKCPSIPPALAIFCLLVVAVLQSLTISGLTERVKLLEKHLQSTNDRQAEMFESLQKSDRLLLDMVAPLEHE